MSFKRLTSEQERALIDRVANYIANSGFDVPIQILLEAFKPVSFVTSQWGIFYLGPFIGLSKGDWEETAQNLVRLFENEENISRIIKRVQEIKEQNETNLRLVEPTPIQTRETFFRRFRRILLGF